MKHTARWLCSTWAANLRSALEYRTSFLVQAAFMAANNFLFLAFWAVFFHRFPRVAGWGMADVALLFAVVATAFGLGVILFGGCLDLARRIADGRLDTWLLRPRPVFLQAGASRMGVAGWGDVTSGIVLLFLSGNGEPRRLAAFVAMTLLSLVGFVAFATACNAVAFFAGRAEALAEQGVHSMLAFTCYPPGLFGGWSKLLLYVVLPAGLVGWAPAGVVREWSWPNALAVAGGVAALAGATAVAWRVGLARYESGNLTQALDA